MENITTSELAQELGRSLSGEELTVPEIVPVVREMAAEAQRVALNVVNFILKVMC